MSFGNTYAFNRDKFGLSSNKSIEDLHSQRSMRATKISFNRRVFTKRPSFAIPSSRKKLQHSATTNRNTYFDVESLYAENIAIKCKIYELDEEYMILKKRMMDLEGELSVKSEGTERVYIMSGQQSIVPELKGTIKELKEKLIVKESEAEDLRAKIKNKRIVEAENEIKQQIQACISLKSQLEQVLTKRVINLDIQNAKERYERNIGEIEELNKTKEDYRCALGIINKELVNARSQEFVSETSFKAKTKKMKLKSRQIKVLKNDGLILNREIFAQEQVFKLKEDQLLVKVDELNEILLKNQSVLSSLETQFNEKTEKIQKIKQITNNIKNYIKRSRTMNLQEVDITQKKLQNPPKFFSKIHKIISQKHLIIEVFLSLLDKNNTQMVTNDDLFKMFNDRSIYISKKYIENAIRLMGCTNRHIPLSKIEEWYERYEYLEEECLSSEADDEFQLLTKSISCSNIFIDEKTVDTYRVPKHNHNTSESHWLTVPGESNLH